MGRAQARPKARRGHGPGWGVDAARGQGAGVAQGRARAQLRQGAGVAKAGHVGGLEPGAGADLGRTRVQPRTGGRRDPRLGTARPWGRRLGLEWARAWIGAGSIWDGHGRRLGRARSGMGSSTAWGARRGREAMRV